MDDGYIETTKPLLPRGLPHLKIPKYHNQKRDQRAVKRVIAQLAFFVAKL